MMGFLQALGSLRLLYWVTTILFGGLIICMILNMILSWLPMLSPANPIMRFVRGVTSPMIDPIRKLLPSMNIGPLDMSYTIAFIFVAWSLSIIEFLIQSSLPPGW